MIEEASTNVINVDEVLRRIADTVCPEAIEEAAIRNFFALCPFENMREVERWQKALERISDAAAKRKAAIKHRASLAYWDF